jgi:crossover junction endodeoxyribonuclease RuvC
MRVLGIDPGLNITGYALLESKRRRTTLIEAGVIRTRLSDSMPLRLVEISRELQSIIAQFHPDALAIEEVYSHYEHPRTAIVMGHARGVAILEAARSGMDVFAYASTRVKKSLTGNGRASKLQMQKMIKSTLNLPEIPEPPDAADALAIALCHCRSLERSEAKGL